MVEEKALISVIVPVYKVEKYLDKCVRSILAQTYKNLEVILVDDGSPDCSGEMCDALAAEDPRVRVIHQENGGVSAARNAGLSIMTGQYFSFVDSDDLVEPTLIESLWLAIKENDADLAICGIKWVTQNREDLWEAKQETVSGRENIAAYLTNHFLEWIACSPCAKLYKSDALGALQFDRNISLGEDLKFNIEYIAKINKVSVIKSCLYAYMDCAGSLTRNFNRGHYEAICNVYELMMAYLKWAVPDINKVDVSKVNYKLFAHCCTFMARNALNATPKSAILFNKEICENALVRKAVSNLPRMSVFHRTYAWAINHKCATLLYVFSVLRNSLVKQK